VSRHFSTSSPEQRSVLQALPMVEEHHSMQASFHVLSRTPLPLENFESVFRARLLPHRVSPPIRRWLYARRRSPFRRCLYCLFVKSEARQSLRQTLLRTPYPPLPLPRPSRSVLEAMQTHAAEREDSPALAFFFFRLLHKPFHKQFLFPFAARFRWVTRGRTQVEDPLFRIPPYSSNLL